jgi:TetR/AcrR family fatty acid metabolism transcriptional regulator
MENNMSPKKVNKEEKKLQIVNAAIKVIAQKGTGQARMIDIAREAGIGKGTIYEYFRNQDEILREAFYGLMGRMQESMQKIISSDKSPEEKLHQSMREAVIEFDKMPDDMIVIFVDFWSRGIIRDEKPGQFIIDMKGLYGGFREGMAGIIQEGIDRGDFKKEIDPIVTASALIGMGDGLILQIIYDRENIGGLSIIEKAVDTMIKGIKK